MYFNENFIREFVTYINLFLCYVNKTLLYSGKFHNIYEIKLSNIKI